MKISKLRTLIILIIALTTIGGVFVIAEALTNDGMQVNSNEYVFMNARTPGSDIPERVLPIEDFNGGIIHTRTPGSDIPETVNPGET